MQKKYFLLFVFTASFIVAGAQPKPGQQKYPSLFWEITGPGLSKPSYLFGTMHVSSKLVFHLPDSFYLDMKNVDMVALETNPETWQDDLSKYEMDANSLPATYRNRESNNEPNDYLKISTFSFEDYEKTVEASLYNRPSTINNLLYRSNTDASADFEENTYLDMYIYQVGKKMGKRVAGVEKYDESLRLMLEAYRDASKDMNRKERSFDSDDMYSPSNLQEAYRTGNLDRLDSINRLNSVSDAFDEKFLYRRNELQANSIDSIIRSHTALFVGVGAAHLPGNRGVIELLRKKGYHLRPIIMGERDSRHKDLVEKMKVPVTFNTQTSHDGFFKVDMPGKLYQYSETTGPEQMQYADMANGSYYLVTRIKTNSIFWGQPAAQVEKKIDSLLYENIPGKIITRQEFTRNGYRGLDILNRTRRGDIQRNMIFITPYEVIVFRMSGNGDYVKDGEESKRFFSSIQLKENTGGTWQTWQPSFGGFRVKLPTAPYISKEQNWQFSAYDNASATNFTILRADINNLDFAEEDSFDLALIDESLASAAFIDKQISRKQSTWNGYPAMDVSFLDKDGSVLKAKYIIQGPHYYALLAQSKKENPAMQDFFNSFEITAFRYDAPFVYTDSTFNYHVSTPYFPRDKKIKISLPAAYGEGEEDDGRNSKDSLSGKGFYKSTIIANDSTGEKIYLVYYRRSLYETAPDSTKSAKTQTETWITKSKKRFTTADNFKVTDKIISDTGSSRAIRVKTFSHKGTGYYLAAEIDTLTAPSPFIHDYFENFTPGKISNVSVENQKASAVFFNDYLGSDTSLHKRAARSVEDLSVDSADFNRLRLAIEATGWKEKNYMELRKSLVGKLATLKTKAASDYLKNIYTQASDTIEFQYAALSGLISQQTVYSFGVLRDILVADPPVLETSEGASYAGDYDNETFIDDLDDSLQLARTILPGILPLVNVDDYKWPVMNLLGSMIDSNLAKAEDYEPYFKKFYLEARQEWKKQNITEKKRSIEKASQENETPTSDKDKGNDNLELYAKLLMPFWDIHPEVRALLTQMLYANDRKLRFPVLMLFTRNNHDVPDSLYNDFASKDVYRYRLYTSLEEMGKLAHFSSIYNNHIDLAKSKLISTKTGDDDDSISYVDRVAISYRGVDGWIYFFKYKEKKDDLSWKLASVGLVPRDQHRFVLRDKKDGSEGGKMQDAFTSFGETKMIAGKPVMEQLKKATQKMLYAKRKSGKEFYDSDKNDYLKNLIRRDY
jgi:uncharacterized protein YbaP (TraB family)